MATRPATPCWWWRPARPCSTPGHGGSRETDEFFRDRQYGELWAGRRPSLKEISDSLGIETRHLDELEGRLSASAKTRVLGGVDARVDALVAGDSGRDGDFARVLSELRLVKDEWELSELQSACDITTLGFEDSVREWDRVLEHGERWLEGTFFRRARTMGNDIGYDSIVGGGRHATTLHWIDNSGPITPGELVLLDMGAEATSLYTADVTRTLPVDGTFTSLQRDLYSLVLTAQQAGIDAVRPGAAFRAPHEAAMSVLAHGLGDLGVLPVSAEEALSPDSRVYARWTLHGTSHMLGLDVHDCAAADTGIYPGGDLAEGMVLTVEPGLYFQEDDLLVPEELRGIGIRIEDDVVVTADGCDNLSAALAPRSRRDRVVDGGAARLKHAPGRCHARCRTWAHAAPPEGPRATRGAKLAVQLAPRADVVPGDLSHRSSSSERGGLGTPTSPSNHVCPSALCDVTLGAVGIPHLGRGTPYARGN